MSALAQLQASDPRASAFVAAHAGTGKTKLLVDRLLRLMLGGADPARILCLTYTRAAAAEMAVRLQRQLGQWVTLPDDALKAQLAALEVAPEAVSRARELFARVLDLPGGMRIGTIHAFCQSLLRRFPLEARISPHFALLDESDAREALEQAREALLPVADPAVVAAVAGQVNADGFAALVRTLEGARDRLGPVLALSPAALEAAIRCAAGVTAPNAAALIAGAVTWPQEAAIRRAALLMANEGTEAVKKKGAALLGWLGLPPTARAEHFASWVEEFLRDDGAPRGPSIFARAKLAERYPEITPLCIAEQDRLARVQDDWRALRMVEATAALLRLAGPILAHTAAARSRRGLLDYADLISRTYGLLADAEIGVAWVLYKLDGGLDHLLLDEVQDTAPQQWDIADRLTADFFTGSGAREDAPLPRTVFAVGDRKQSIYAFQGAAPAAFDQWRDIFRTRAGAAGADFRVVQLATSFRSTAPVLALVDAVFAEAPASDGVRAPDEPPLCHAAHRVGAAGRVELWPLAPRPPAPEPTPWHVPERNQSQVSAPQTLIAALAAWIAREVGGGTMLESAGRPLRAGDVLVLVRRRGQFAGALVRALKKAGVRVAGLDRMVLTEQPAVADLLSLCDALLLPRDELALAEMLTSPLGGLSDDSLMTLAAGRTATLWETLRARAPERPDWQAAATFFSTLLARTDFVAPHALLTEALGALGGRARLFARLGPEAAEPVDELLAAALTYAGAHPPSLQGFVHWVRQSGAEVKREAEAAGDSVRVMTVHGSKGLEAPLVILPDTTALPPDEAGFAWAAADGIEIPLWQPNTAFRCAAVESRRAAAEAARLQEYRRLLYVALTRACDRLLVCGWETARQPEGTWYQLVEAGMRRLAPKGADFGPWPGETLWVETPQMAAPEKPKHAAAAELTPLPAWAGAAPAWRPARLPPEPVRPRPLAPSRPDGVELGPVPAARSPLRQVAEKGRFGRGLAMHALLQHLPDLPAGSRAEAALAFASQKALGLDQPGRLAAQALAVLEDPRLAPLFGPGSRAEQRISGLVGGHIVSGQVDRLAILAGKILIADYKTQRDPPQGAEKVPVLYLRQMAAYRAVLRLLHPDRPVSCILIWTEGPVAMTLPDMLLDSHAPGAFGPGHAA